MHEQGLFFAIVFQPLVGAQPDAVAVTVHFATAFPRPAAGTVPLVLGALGFRTEERNVRQGTIAAIFALEQNGFAEMFNGPERFRTLAGVLGVPADFRSPIAQGRSRREHDFVGPLGKAVQRADVF